MKKLILLLSLSRILFAEIDENGDFQIWSKNIIRQHIRPQWGMAYLLENRIGDHASKLYHTLFQIQLVYKPTPWMSLAPGYRQNFIRTPLNSTRWKPVYGPLTDLSLTGIAGGWEFTDRNRFQCDIAEAHPSYNFIYRNRFRIIPPWNFSRFKFNPFIDNEIFLRQHGGFNEDRFSAGLLLLIKGNLSGQVFYMRRYEKRLHPTHWIHQNILNITLLLAY